MTTDATNPAPDRQGRTADGGPVVVANGTAGAAGRQSGAEAPAGYTTRERTLTRSYDAGSPAGVLLRENPQRIGYTIEVEDPTSGGRLLVLHAEELPTAARRKFSVPGGGRYEMPEIEPERVYKGPVTFRWEDAGAEARAFVTEIAMEPA